MAVMIKCENDSQKYGLAIDPCDPGLSPIRYTFWPYHAGMSGDGASHTWAVLTEHYPSRTVESFARETLGGPVGDVSNWDDETVLAGMKAECGEIRALDANYPGRYHRLGTYILESTKRFGGDAVRQTLRAEGINSTKAYWAKEIALLYTYEQATAFASVRAIVRTLPPKQPRKAKRTAGDPQVTADIEQTILDSPAQTADGTKCCTSIKEGDVLAVLQKMDANTFDGCFHDGPYALTTIGKRFGGRTSKPPKTDKGSNGVYGRIAKGFMNQTWDGDLPSVETYQELLRVCKPGSWMLAFGHPRTWHRLACNIEDAGWELRDCLMWFYGQGFPKSRDLRTIGEAWAGYGFALKPGYEPIILAMKPLEGSFADNARKWGVAGLNIEGCRIGQDEITINRWTDGCKPFGNGAGHPYDTHHSEGRYPANVMLDEEAARLLDLQGPISRGGQYRRSGERDCRHKGNQLYGGGIGGGQQNAPDCYGDAGGVSRFFYCAKAGPSERNAGLDDFPVKRPDSRSEAGMGFFKQHGIQPQRNDHPCVKPLALTKWLARLILPPKQSHPRKLLVPYCGSGSEVIGAMLAGWDEVLGIEWNRKYINIANARIEWWRSQG